MRNGEFHTSKCVHLRFREPVQQLLPRRLPLDRLQPPGGHKEELPAGGVLPKAKKVQELRLEAHMGHEV